VKSMPKSEKTFDCIAFKREAQARIYDEIKDMTPQQQIAYYRHAARNGPLGAWWRRISEQPNDQADQ